ncbi:hypothetical protein GCM10010994_47130 [Chelatococcus reniformis]|uniref:MgtC/SapB/SrpB/YhiD N-terminal domain-containing protein n=1 Tax=Chelatococcus reniformis TaxID=1494448 RepID=A0A916UR57_9HYPH|nr:hypothetical protein GCM10010994_47130 [Chelatococcus reniformis]
MPHEWGIMRFIETFQIYDFVDTTASLFFAFVLGRIIGVERQYRQRTAGLRTNVLEHFRVSSNRRNALSI